MKKWIVGCLILGPIVIAVADLFNLWWLKVIVGAVLLGTVYAIVLVRDMGSPRRDDYGD